MFGGLFGKVSMYGDKEEVVVFSGDNPKCFFDIQACVCCRCSISCCPCCK